MIDGAVVLITGGTGSLGQRLARMILTRHAPARLIVFSRDELKQHQMRQALSEREHPCLRFMLGDVRDRQSLLSALAGVDVVVHTAALKQVPGCEENALEAIKTNILGAANTIEAAQERGVGRVLALSTDKAAHPINLYGATKLCAEKLFTSAAGHRGTRCAVVRYGNVVGSRGSVVPLFLDRRECGVLPITDPRMTRFWLTLDRAARFTLVCLARMEGGEIFVPKIPSMRVVDLARAVAPECRLEVVGIRPGEKLHEVLIPEEAARSTIEFDDFFAVLPDPLPGGYQGRLLDGAGRPCADGFRYASDSNTHWLTLDELRSLVGLEEHARAA